MPPPSFDTEHVVSVIIVFSRDWDIFMVVLLVLFEHVMIYRVLHGDFESAVQINPNIINKYFFTDFLKKSGIFFLTFF